MDPDKLISTEWLLVCTILVFAMQVGFCCLESGFVRAKNSVNVAMKNLVDFMVAGLLFWAAGYALMFGTSFNGWIGTTGWLHDSPNDPWDSTFLLFQLMFCGAAATIVSGAIAERIKFSAYILITIICSLVIYPVFGHWAWAGANVGTQTGWLGALGFIDFAGSTVVHSVGGWVALGTLFVIGPRIGAFSGKRGSFMGSNLPIATVGALLLWFGWFGFNGGSALTMDASVPHILINTVLGGCAGGIAALIVGYTQRERPQAADLINGTIAGLVAITANCHIVSSASAVLIGAIGGMVCIGGIALLARLRIDDAVSAVPVHLFAGIWGTLAVALFGDPAAFPFEHTRLEQLGVQLTGIAACAALALPTTWLLLSAINRIHPLRVRRDEEELGLSIAEHDAGTPLLSLISEMETHRRLGRIDRPVAIEIGSDVEPLAIQYNRVAESLAAETAKLRRTVAELTRARDEAKQANEAKSAFLANMSHELRTPLNAIIGFSEIITLELYGPIENEKYTEMADDILSSGRLLLSLVSDILDHSKIEAGMLELAEEPVDLAAMFDEVARLVVPRADANGLAILTQVSDDQPLLMADWRSIRQIMLNLVSNAIKFSEAGGAVTLEATHDHQGIAISVIDAGIGMNAADIKRALEPFVQLDNHLTKRHAGTGLGLTLVQSLAKLHGAELTIDSRLNAGTRVRIAFPATRTCQMSNKANAAA